MRLKKICFFAVAILIAGCNNNSGNSMENVEPITLQNPKDIQDASNVSNALNKMSKKVMECVEKKLAPANECFCLYPDEILNLKEAYNDALNKHSEWKDQVIYYKTDSDDYSHNISFKGLRLQLETKCP